MHEVHAVHHAFLKKPTNSAALKAALSPILGGKQTLISDDSERGKEALAKAVKESIGFPYADVNTIQSNPPGWYLQWHGQQMLVTGVVVAGDQARGQIDPDSPLVLIDRFSGEFVTGPDVAAFTEGPFTRSAGRHVLSGLGNIQASTTYEKAFDFADWGQGDLQELVPPTKLHWGRRCQSLWNRTVKTGY